MDIAALAKKAAAAKPMPCVNVPAPEAGVVAHIDGDFCAYNLAGRDDTDPGQARRNLLHKFESIKYASGATSVMVHLTDNASTKGDRYLAATVKPYQGQRNSSRKPKNWAVLREFMENYDGDKFTVKNWMTREADDGMAYVAYAAAAAGKRAVIATKDKDMRMLPGRHIVWETRQLVDVPFNTFAMRGPDDKIYGHLWFWLQMLQGDTADNIPGLPKYVNERGNLTLCGEKTAPKLLQGCVDNADAQEVVTDLYKGFYQDTAYDRLVEQASLLWLRTDRHANIRNLTEVMPTPDKKLTEAVDALVARVAEKKKEVLLLCGG